MRSLLTLLLLVTLALPAAARSITIGGTTWTDDVEAAFETAARTKKPVLVLAMFGQLDERFC